MRIWCIKIDIVLVLYQYCSFLLDDKLYSLVPIQDLLETLQNLFCLSGNVQ
jgi:hypothetical protein